MSDRRTTQQPTTGERFMRGAGEVNDPENKLWGPARWVVQMVQYLVAIIILTIGKGIEAIFKGEKPSKRKARDQ